jgi:hypothetical protein
MDMLSATEQLWPIIVALVQEYCLACTCLSILKQSAIRPSQVRGSYTALGPPGKLATVSSGAPIFLADLVGRQWSEVGTNVQTLPVVYSRLVHEGLTSTHKTTLHHSTAPVARF